MKLLRRVVHQGGVVIEGGVEEEEVSVTQAMDMEEEEGAMVVVDMEGGEAGTPLSLVTGE